VEFIRKIIILLSSRYLVVLNLFNMLYIKHISYKLNIYQFKIQ